MPIHSFRPSSNVTSFRKPSPQAGAGAPGAPRPLLDSQAPGLSPFYCLGHLVCPCSQPVSPWGQDPCPVDLCIPEVPLQGIAWKIVLSSVTDLSLPWPPPPQPAVPGSGFRPPGSVPSTRSCPAISSRGSALTLPLPEGNHGMGKYELPL